MGRRVKQAAACVLAGAFLAWWMDRPGEIPAPVETPSVSEHAEAPEPHPLMPPGAKQAQAHASATATPWYANWEFYRKSICIESGIVGAPLAKVAEMYRVKGIRIYVRFAYGQCQAAGFGPSQRVVFSYYTAEDKASPTLGGACAFTRAENYGYLRSVLVRVNVLGGASGKRTACGAGSPGEWREVFAHEMGHAMGFTHQQPYVSSIMRDGHWTNSTDVAYLGKIYSNNPY